MAKKKMTKEESNYIDQVVEMGCVVCGLPGEWHHARCFGVAGKKAPHCIGFCLCTDHHRTGGKGVAIHASQMMFEGNFGTEGELIQQTILNMFNRY